MTQINETEIAHSMLTGVEQISLLQFKTVICLNTFFSIDIKLKFVLLYYIEERDDFLKVLFGASNSQRWGT